MEITVHLISLHGNIFERMLLPRSETIENSWLDTYSNNSDACNLCTDRCMFSYATSIESSPVLSLSVSRNASLSGQGPSPESEALRDWRPELYK